MLEYPTNYLWESFESLREVGIPVYIDLFEEIEEEQPQVYLFIDTLINDSPDVFGDGKYITRINSFTLTLSAVNLGTLKDKAEIVRERLDELGLSFNQLSIIKDTDGRYYSTQFISSFIY
jgi:lipoate synthase